MNEHHRRAAGFTLIELIVVILVLAVLAGVLIPRVTDRMAAARDAKRLADINAIETAIERYFHDKGVYPPASQNGSYGGWDVSLDGDMIPELLKTGYLTEMPADPLNNETYHYRYFVYAKGTAGCVGDGPFYVLGIKNFETQDFKTRNPGFFKCGGRDWNAEFAYVTGGGASLK